jgi:hypothetical protein
MSHRRTQSACDGPCTRIRCTTGARSALPVVRETSVTPRLASRTQAPMPAVADRTLSIGAPHRALQALSVLVYEYDALGVTTRLMPAGALFRPWAPLEHQQGERVPITLGTDDDARCEWSAASPTAYFVRWDDFFARCAPAAATDAVARPRIDEQPIASPFAELPAIAARLRAAATTAGARAELDELLAVLARIAAAHARAADMQRGAEGYDNTETARRWADVQAQLLAGAREVLRAARALV